MATHHVKSSGSRACARRWTFRSKKTSDVATLQSALDAVKDDKTILSPYPDLPAPVVITVWNAQLDLKSASDPRLATFISEYGDGHTAPEAAVASCAGGKVVYASPDNP